MTPRKRKVRNTQPEGIFGTQGLINPRAPRKQIGSSPSLATLLMAAGQAMNARADEKSAEETENAAEDLRSTGGLYASAFDDGSGGGKQCIINEDGEIDCTGQPTDQGGNSGVEDGLARGGKSKSLGDFLIAAARRSSDRKKERQKTNKALARFFENHSTIGNHENQLNIPPMQLLARLFDARAQSLKARRTPGNYGGSYSF